MTTASRQFRTDEKIEIVSGEGDGEGTVEAFGGRTEAGLKRRLTKERCDGDRWAFARYADSGERFDI